MIHKHRMKTCRRKFKLNVTSEKAMSVTWFATAVTYCDTV